MRDGVRAVISFFLSIFSRGPKRYIRHIALPLVLIVLITGLQTTYAQPDPDKKKLLTVLAAIRMLLLNDDVPPSTTASPPGGSFNEAQSVAYNSPITIGSNTTLKFFAVDTVGNEEAPIKTHHYIIDTVAPVTTASPPGGSYNETQSVVLTATRFDGESSQYTYNFGWRIYYSGQGFFQKPEPTGWPELTAEWTKTDIALKRLQEANNTLHDTRWAISLVDFFTDKNLTTERAILEFLLPMTTAGYYTGLDIQKGYDILRPAHAQFTMDETRLRELLAWLVAQAEFHVH